MKLRSEIYFAAFVCVAALWMLTGCGVDNAVPPRTPPIGMPAQLIPARPEGHLVRQAKP